MILKPHGREFYDPRPSTTPEVAGWVASFDGGETWKPQETIDDLPKWLVAGVKRGGGRRPEGHRGREDPGAAVAVLTDSVTPLLKAVDTPEEIVREGPAIYVQ